MLLQVFVAVAKTLKHNEQLIEHVFALQKLWNAPRESIVDVMQATASAEKPWAQDMQSAFVLRSSVH